MKQNTIWQQPNVTAGGCAVIISLNLGAISLMPLVVPDVMAALQCTMTQIALVGTFATLSGFVFSILGARLITAFTPKWSLLAGTLAGCLSLMLYALAPNLLVVYCGGLLSGATMGLGMHASVAAIVAGWFGQRMQPIIGVIFGISSFCSAGMQFVTGRLLGTMDYRQVFLIMAAVVGGLGLLANFTAVHNPPVEDTPVANLKQQNEGLLLRQAVKTPAFLLFFVAMVLAATLFSGFSLFAPTFWQSYGVSVSVSASYMSMLTFCGAVITLFSGFIVQKFGIRILLLLTFGGFIAGMLCICSWPRLQTFVFTLLCAILIAFVRPVNGIPSLILPELFGKRDYTRINAVGMAGYYLGAALSTLLVGAIAEISGSFITSFLILAVFAALAFVLFLGALHLSPYTKTADTTQSS